MKKTTASKIKPKRRKTSSGKIFSCREKIKILNQDIEEVNQVCQDALEDALLMDCDESQFRDAIFRVVDNLTNPYKKKEK